MYEYRFVEATIRSLFTQDNHQDLINDYAKQGWRLVQVLYMNHNMDGRPMKCEVIFEREIKEGEYQYE